MEIYKTATPLKFVFLFIALLLAQVLICNNILLFGVAVPFVYIYFILVLPLDTNPKLMMLLGFTLGFMVDVFCDTLGLNSLCCLILSVLRKPIFYAYIPREDKYLNAMPCISTMGWFNFVKYSLTASLTFCTFIFAIELFSFVSFGRIIVMILSSSLLSMFLILAIDSIFNRAKRDS